MIKEYERWLSFNENEDIHKLLNLLAKRVNAANTYWLESEHYLDSCDFVVCCICNYEFLVERNPVTHAMSFGNVMKHGMQHIKESNLLPFI